MKVTLEAAHESHKGNPPQLEIQGVLFRNREAVENFIKHVQMEMDQLWPEEPKEKSEK